LERTGTLKVAPPGVHSNYDVPVAGGEVVCLLVCDAIFLVYESCEDVAWAGIKWLWRRGY
jgi:hypothetical protein